MKLKMDDDSKNNIFIALRPMNCEINLLTRSDGSAILSQGETVVLASVNGPIEVKLQNLVIEKAYVEVNFRSKSGMTNVYDRLREQIIKETCESAILTSLHPRTNISIQLQEMEDRSGLIACAINATCLAVLNSGLPMKYLFAAVHCIIDKDNEFIIDPNHRQTKDAKAYLTFVFDSIDLNCIVTHTTGIYTIGQYNDIHVLCKEASKHIFQFYRDIVKKTTNILE